MLVTILLPLERVSVLTECVKRDNIKSPMNDPLLLCIPHV